MSDDKQIKIPRWLLKALVEALDGDPPQVHTAREAWAKWSREKLLG